MGSVSEVRQGVCWGVVPMVKRGVRCWSGAEMIRERLSVVSTKHAVEHKQQFSLPPRNTVDPDQPYTEYMCTYIV